MKKLLKAALLLPVLLFSVPVSVFSVSPAETAAAASVAPATGDNTLWLFVLLAACVVAIVVILILKKKEK